MKFSERLKAACAKVGIEWSQTAIGRALGVSKQTADRWMGDGQPAADTLFDVADKLRARGAPMPYSDPRWLATGQEPAATTKGEDPLVSQMVAHYKRADPRWQLSLRLLSAIAVEDQPIVAGDVNMVVARILGMKPKDLRYPPDEVVAQKLGKAKHVIERETREGSKK